MSALGSMYLEGSGLAKDEVQAVEWYKKAAAAGSVYGMNNLGVMYQEGRGGLPLDKYEAKKLFLKSGNIGLVPRVEY